MLIFEIELHIKEKCANVLRNIKIIMYHSNDSLIFLLATMINTLPTRVKSTTVTLLGHVRPLPSLKPQQTEHSTNTNVVFEHV